MTTLSHITAAVENNAIIMSTRVTRSRRYWPKCVRERALQASERHQSIIIMTLIVNDYESNRKTPTLSNYANSSRL